MGNEVQILTVDRNTGGLENNIKMFPVHEGLHCAVSSRVLHLLDVSGSLLAWHYENAIKTNWTIRRQKKNPVQHAH